MSVTELERQLESIEYALDLPSIPTHRFCELVSLHAEVEAILFASLDSFGHGA